MNETLLRKEFMSVITVAMREAYERHPTEIAQVNEVLLPALFKASAELILKHMDPRMFGHLISEIITKHDLWNNEPGQRKSYTPRLGDS